MRSARQRGVAIITALVVVAAATVAVAAMMWRQSIAVRKVENQADLAEARWLARSSIDWARLLLQLDARTSTVDHLGEIWATPLEETRVTEDLAMVGQPAAARRDAPAADLANNAAWVSGRMRDAQSRVNLTGLVPGEKADEKRLGVVTRLLKLLNLPSSTADAVVAAMSADPVPSTFDELAARLAEGDVRRETIERLRPFVDILPVATPVNLNTAPPEVVAACFEDLPLDAARALVRSRDQAWFNQINDAVARLPGTSGNIVPTNVSVNSRFFEVEGRVRIGRADIEIDALVERDAGTSTRVRSFVER